MANHHMKLIVTDHRHDLAHWLMVVLIRIFFAVVLIPVSFYLIALGFLLSHDVLQPYWPVLLGVVGYYSVRLPGFLFLKTLLFDRLNHWYRDAPIWWGMVVGLPLILMGLALFLINFTNLILAITRPSYNRTHCPFCKQPIKLQVK